MAAVWNGSALQIRFVQKYGINDTASYVRVLEWMNDIQDDIQAYCGWPFLKFKMKKQVVSGEQEINIAPQIPSTVTIALASGGSITTASICYVKTTFLLFDEGGREIDSLESEPGLESNAVTTTGSTLSIAISAIPLFNGTATVKPTVIHRRIYLKIGSSPYYLSTTLTNNTATTATITTVPTSIFEPPEYSLVSLMSSEDPFIEGTGVSLVKEKLDNILKYDPTFSASGTPSYYARTGTEKIFIYPKPSSTYTISYWVYRIPSRIYADTTRPIQLLHSLKETLEAGVTWKFYEFKDQDGQESKKANYERKKEEVKGTIGRTGGGPIRVKEVF